MAVFAALIVLSLCGLGWYLVAGHSWNVAASNIDDTFGNMDGYTAIVYAGTAEKSKDASEKTVEDTPTSDEKTLLPNGTAPDDSLDSDRDPDDTPASAGTGTLENSDSSKSSKPPLKVDDVQQSYEDKKATVFSLDTENLGQYSEGTILKKGDHRFGVFSVTAPMSLRALEKQVAYFAMHDVDFIMVITPDKAYVDGASGIDIVISTQDEDLFVMGETIDGTFYVDAPEVGKVGTILISPSNVVSAKVIEEL